MSLRRWLRHPNALSMKGVLTPENGAGKKNRCLLRSMTGRGALPAGIPGEKTGMFHQRQVLIAANNDMIQQRDRQSMQNVFHDYRIADISF